MQQFVHADAFANLHTQPTRRTRKAGGHKVGIGKPCFGFEADQRGIVKARDGQQLRRLLRVQFVHSNTLRSLTRKARTQWRQATTFRRRYQVAALHEARRGFRVAEVVREVGEHVPGRTRQLHVLRDRVMRAQNARRLRRGARTYLQPVQHQHAAGTELAEVKRDRAANHAGANHDDVETFHRRVFPRLNNAGAIGNEPFWREHARFVPHANPHGTWSALTHAGTYS